MKAIYISQATKANIKQLTFWLYVAQATRANIKRNTKESLIYVSQAEWANVNMEKLTFHRSHKVRPTRQQPTAKQERKRNEENKYLRFLRGALTGRLPSVLRSGQSLNLFLLRSIRSLSHSENTKLQRRGRWVESKPIRVTLRARMEMRGRVWNERTLKWQKANPKGVA